MFCKVKYCNFNKHHTTKYHTCGLCKQKGHGATECNFNLKKEELKQYFIDKLPIDKHCQINNCTEKDTHTSSSHICHFCNERHSEEICPKKPNIDIILDCPICRKENKIPITQKKIYGLQEKCKVCLTNNIELYLNECGHACLCIECSRELNKNDNDYIIQTENEIMTNDYWHNHIDKCKKTFKDINGKIYTEINAGMGCIWFFRRENKFSPIEGFFLHNDCLGQYNIDHIPYTKLFSFGYKFITQYDPYGLF